MTRCSMKHSPAATSSHPAQTSPTGTYNNTVTSQFPLKMSTLLVPTKMSTLLDSAKMSASRVHAKMSTSLGPAKMSTSLCSRNKCLRTSFRQNVCVTSSRNKCLRNYSSRQNVYVTSSRQKYKNSSSLCRCGRGQRNDFQNRQNICSSFNNLF